MVLTNFQTFWLTALLLIGAVLPLVRGEYATCPTTGWLSRPYDLQNPASYYEKSCTGRRSKCCSSKYSYNNHGERRIIYCSDSCEDGDVDCSDAANRCRNVADVVAYYKSSEFITCPFNDGRGWTDTIPTSIDVAGELLCPATDKCSVVRMKESRLEVVNAPGFNENAFGQRQDPRRYSAAFWCMKYCKEQKAFMNGQMYAYANDCTECSSADDCKQKLAQVVSHFSCPTTKGEKVITENAAFSDFHEKSCIGSEKCCAERSVVGLLTMIEVKCSASCTNTQVDCKDAANRCRDVEDIIGQYQRPDSRSQFCPEANEERRDYLLTKFPPGLVSCPATEKCYFLIGLIPNDWGVKIYRYYLGCMEGCIKKMSNSYSYYYTTNCTACSSMDDCQLKFEKAISIMSKMIYPRCPTTKGLTLVKKSAIENASSYKETPCPIDSVKCCAEKSTYGKLTIKIACSASCVSPQVDCSQEGNRCSNVTDITRNLIADYVPCFNHQSLGAQRVHLNNFSMIFCPKREKCYVGRVDSKLDRVHNISEFTAFAGCRIECKRFFRNNKYRNVCKRCSTPDDCRKILEDGFIETTRKIVN